MKSIVNIILFFSGVTANLSGRQSTPGCCFQLSSAGDLNAVVEESDGGGLLLGGSFQDAEFCLDKTTRTVKDRLGNSCFIQDPNQKLACVAGAAGPTAFDITQPDSYERSYLIYGNGTRLFHACPAGSANDKSYYIYSDGKPDKTGCFEVNLNIKDQASECHARNPTLIASAPVSNKLLSTTTIPTSASTGVLPTVTYNPITQIGLLPSTIPTTTTESGQPTTTTSTSSSLTSSQTCMIASSAPSIAPNRVGYLDPEASGIIRDSFSEVSISPKNSTIFEYSIPQSFIPANASLDGEPQLCALQFRMPVCTELPKGYPCYDFSGLEQEILSDSGINFTLTVDDGMAVWDNTALHQVFPGEDSIIGTFECGRPAGSYGSSRRISWQASSVRNFSLEFLQAGVGDHPEFHDGIGAWIVPCS